VQWEAALSTVAPGNICSLVIEGHPFLPSSFNLWCRCGKRLSLRAAARPKRPSLPGIHLSFTVTGVDSIRLLHCKSHKSAFPSPVNSRERYLDPWRCRSATAVFDPFRNRKSLREAMRRPDRWSQHSRQRIELYSRDRTTLEQTIVCCGLALKRR